MFEKLKTILFFILMIFLSISCNTKENNNMKTSEPVFRKDGELSFLDKSNKFKLKIDIEIADDDLSRQIGMMGRTHNNELQGMLFVFEEEHYASFWMKNTIIPLDMIFINKNGKIVTIHKNTTPFLEESYTATDLTMFVLEVNGGFCDRNNIEVGDFIEWKKINKN